jgi:hypothetical protein
MVLQLRFIFGVLRFKFQGFKEYGFQVRFLGFYFWSFKIMVLMLRFKRFGCYD